MDQIDVQLLSILQRDGRMTISDLSKSWLLAVQAYQKGCSAFRNEE